MRSVQIKAIDNNEFDIWLPLWKGYQRFYEVDIPESVTLQTWARFLDPVEPMYAALAMLGEQTLGRVHSIYHRSTWTTSDYCYLQDLFVADDARGGGVGRALIEHVYAMRAVAARPVCIGRRTNPTITPCSFTTVSLIARLSSSTENYMPDTLVRVRPQHSCGASPKTNRYSEGESP